MMIIFRSVARSPERSGSGRSMAERELNPGEEPKPPADVIRDKESKGSSPAYTFHFLPFYNPAIGEIPVAGSVYVRRGV